MPVIHSSIHSFTRLQDCFPLLSARINQHLRGQANGENDDDDESYCAILPRKMFCCIQNWWSSPWPDFRVMILSQKATFFFCNHYPDRIRCWTHKTSATKTQWEKCNLKTIFASAFWSSIEMVFNKIFTEIMAWMNEWMDCAGCVKWLRWWWWSMHSTWICSGKSKQIVGVRYAGREREETNKVRLTDRPTRTGWWCSVFWSPPHLHHQIITFRIR